MPLFVFPWEHVDTLFHCGKRGDNFLHSHKSERMEEECASGDVLHILEESPGRTKVFSGLCCAPIVVDLLKRALKVFKKIKK